MADELTTEAAAPVGDAAEYSAWPDAHAAQRAALARLQAQMEKLSEKVDQLMTTQDALNAKEAILETDLANLTSASAAVVTFIQQQNTINAQQAQQIAALQAANPTIDLSGLDDIHNKTIANTATLVQAVTPVVAPTVAATLQPATPAAAPAAAKTS